MNVKPPAGERAMTTDDLPALRVLRDVYRRTEGWPLGVPADERVAEALVRKKFLRYAPPVYLYPGKPRKTYSLTTSGKLVLAGRITL